SVGFPASSSAAPRESDCILSITMIPVTPEVSRRTLSADLMLGRPLVVIDNCNEPLKSTVLVQTLSQTTLSLRMLGKSELVTVRSNAVVIANGNNLIIQSDLT